MARSAKHSFIVNVRRRDGSDVIRFHFADGDKSWEFVKRIRSERPDLQVTEDNYDFHRDVDRAMDSVNIWLPKAAA